MHTDATHTDAPAPVALSEDSAISREQLRILVVDDDETDRLAVRRYVLQLGGIVLGGIVTIDEAASGAEMLEHVAATCYDCILLDYYLPGEDGLALLKAIHERTPTTPVVIFTGRGDEEIAVGLMKAGAADYLPKASLTPARIASSLRHALAIAREAAERRRAEEELRAQDARFRRTLEIETVGILFFTADGQITHANDAFLRMAGYTREDVLDGCVRWDALTPPEWKARSLQAVEEYKATGRTTPYEKQYARKDGSRFWALFAATRLSEREGVEFVLDTSERKRAEEELERLLASEHAARQEAEAARRQVAMQYDVAALLAAAAADDLPPVLPVICQGTVLRWDWGELWQVDMEAGVLRCADVYKAPRTTLREFEAVSRKMRFKPGEGLVGQVLQRGEAIWIADTSHQPRFMRAAAAKKAGLRSGVMVPLRVGDQVVGVLSVFSHAHHDPDLETLSTLVAVGRQIGQFVERRRVEAERILLLERERRARAEAERHAVHTAALQSLTAALAQALSPAEIAAVVTEQGTAALRADAAAAFLLNPATEELEVISDFGYSDQTHENFSRLPLSAHLPLPEAIRSGEPAFFETSEALLTAYPFLAENADVEGYGSHALVPLILDGKVLGGLRFSFSGARTFDAQDRTLMVALEQQCAQALERARLFTAEQAARAEAEAAVRARDEFVSWVVHDLRNPLTVVLAQLQMLHRGAAQGKVLTAQQLAARLETVKASVVRLAAQTDELQDATHLQVGHPLELHRRPTDLVALAREAARTYGQTSASHSVQFETTVPELGGSWDAERLERAVANLVSNAIKYSPSGGAILIRVTRDDDWGILTVEDHGMGIPAQDLPHVFERYRRASNVTQRISGTGLGLAGARDIVEQHGGSITVQSQEGVGATFTVRLPAAAG